MKIGIQELLIVFVVALVVVGPDKLPYYAKKLGQAFGQFRRYTEEATKDIRESVVEPLNEAQKPLREAMAPVTELEKEVRSNVAEIQKSIADIGKPIKEEAESTSGTEAAREEAESTSGTEAAKQGMKSTSGTEAAKQGAESTSGTEAASPEEAPAKEGSAGGDQAAAKAV